MTSEPGRCSVRTPESANSAIRSSCSSGSRSALFTGADTTFDGVRLPDPCLVVLVGATAAGKSHWARTWFGPDQVVSSDRLRGTVGLGERDQRASADAFELLELIADK